MKTKISDYLPQKHKNVKLIQARVPAELLIQVKKVMVKEKYSWSDLFVACLSQFLHEKGHK